MLPSFAVLIGFCKMDTLHMPDDVNIFPLLIRFSSLAADALPSTALATQKYTVSVVSHF